MSRSFRLGMIAGAGQRITELTDQQREERMLDERMTRQEDFQREMAGLRHGYSLELQGLREAAAQRKEEQQQQSQINILTRQLHDFIDPTGVSTLLEAASGMGSFAEQQSFLQDQLLRAEEWFKRTGQPFDASRLAGVGVSTQDLTDTLAETDSAADSAAMAREGIKAADLQDAPTGVRHTEVGAPMPEPRRTPVVEAATPTIEVNRNVVTGMLNGVEPLFPSVPLPPPPMPTMSIQEQQKFENNINSQVRLVFDVERNRISNLVSTLYSSDAARNVTRLEEKRAIAREYDRIYGEIASNTVEKEAYANRLFTGEYLSRVLQSNPNFENSAFMNYPSTEDAVLLRNMVADLQEFVEGYGETITHHTSDAPDGKLKVDSNVVMATLAAIEDRFTYIAVPIALRLAIVDLQDQAVEEEVVSREQPAPVTRTEKRDVPVDVPSVALPQTAEEAAQLTPTQVNPEFANLAYLQGEGTLSSRDGRDPRLTSEEFFEERGTTGIDFVPLLERDFLNTEHLFVGRRPADIPEVVTSAGRELIFRAYNAEDNTVVYVDRLTGDNVIVSAEDVTGR